MSRWLVSVAVLAGVALAMTVPAGAFPRGGPALGVAMARAGQGGFSSMTPPRLSMPVRAPRPGRNGNWRGRGWFTGFGGGSPWLDAASPAAGLEMIPVAFPDGQGVALPDVFPGSTGIRREPTPEPIILRIERRNGRLRVTSRPAFASTGLRIVSLR